MDHRPKCKMKNYKTLKRKIYINLCDLGFGYVVRYNPESIFHGRKKLLSQTLLKLKTSALQKTLLREWKHKPHTGRNYLQNTQRKNISIKNMQRILKIQREGNKKPD